VLLFDGFGKFRVEDSTTDNTDLHRWAAAEIRVHLRHLWFQVLATDLHAGPSGEQDGMTFWQSEVVYGLFPGCLEALGGSLKTWLETGGSGFGADGSGESSIGYLMELNLFGSFGSF
jgi:hypothetical protein